MAVTERVKRIVACLNEDNKVEAQQLIEEELDARKQELVEGLRQGAVSALFDAKKKEGE